MAENQESKVGCCSCCHCSGGKALKAVALVAVGGVLGYLVGGRCGYMKTMCPVMHPPISAPATPQK